MAVGPPIFSAQSAGPLVQPEVGMHGRYNGSPQGWRRSEGGMAGKAGCWCRGESRVSSTGDNASQMRLVVTAAGVLSGSLYDCHCAIDAPDETHGVCRGWTWALNLRDPGGTSGGPYVGSSINNLL